MTYNAELQKKFDNAIEEIIFLYPYVSHTQRNLLDAFYKVILEQFTLHKFIDFFWRIKQARDFIQNAMDARHEERTTQLVNAFNDINDYFAELKKLKINGQNELANEGLTYAQAKLKEKVQLVKAIDLIVEEFKNRTVVMHQHPVNQPLVELQRGPLSSEPLSIATSNPAKPNDEIKQALTTYIERVEKEIENSEPGQMIFKDFNFFKPYRSANREANYRLACQLRTKLESSTISETFKDLDNQRAEVIKTNHIQIHRFFNWGIQSRELNTIIDNARKLEI